MYGLTSSKTCICHWNISKISNSSIPDWMFFFVFCFFLSEHSINVYACLSIACGTLCACALWGDCGQPKNRKQPGWPKSGEVITQTDSWRLTGIKRLSGLSNNNGWRAYPFSPPPTETRMAGMEQDTHASILIKEICLTVFSLFSCLMDKGEPWYCFKCCLETKTLSSFCDCKMLLLLWFNVQMQRLLVL